MPETLPTTSTPAAHRRRRPAPPRASDAEVLALVERAARIPDGLTLLEGAPLECVAVLLGVEPRTVERVRAALEEPALRAEAGRHFVRNAASLRAPAAAPAEAPRSPRDPQALLLAALGRDGGIGLLLSAAPEAAAVAFGVHPELVHRVREAAAESPRPR
jgi:hypothetical protein